MKSLSDLCRAWPISRYHRLWYWKSLQLQAPLISGEIGEDLAYYLTEIPAPSAVGLNVLLDKDDKVEVAGGFLLKLPGAKKKEIARFEKRIRNASHLSPSRKR